jgi:exonuclease III
MIKAISWNCRGLGSRHKLSLIHDLIKAENPHVLLLQETKRKDTDILQERNYIWRSCKGVAVSTRGASGGICTLWNPSIFSLQNWHSTTHWIRTSLLHIPTGKTLNVINVYMPVIYQEKIECWSSLQNLHGSLDSKDLIIAGDLNTTLHPKEKKGGTRVWDPTREHLEDLISSFHLIDIKPSNGRFTWSNKRLGPGHITARLDHFLLRSSFLDESLSPSSLILPWAGSDHRPITLTLSPPENFGPIPFRFNPLWLSDPNFFDIVTDAWSCWIQGSPNYIWEKKLKRVKSTLKHWVKITKEKDQEVKNKKIKEMEENRLEMEEGLPHSISSSKRTTGLHRLSKNPPLGGGNLEAQISESLAQIRRQKHEILSETNQSQTLEEQGEGDHKRRWNKNK